MLKLTMRTAEWQVAVILLAVLLVLGNLAVAWREDVDLRQQGLESAEAKGRQMLTAFTDHAARLLDYGDSHLRAGRAAYQHLGPGPQLRDFLRQSKSLHSDSIIVAETFSDRTGKIIFDSEKTQVPDATAAGLNYFTYFQKHAEDIPYIDPTRFGRVWKQFLFRIVRRLERNGQFDGVAILNMRPENLANFTRKFDLGPHVIYGVVTLDHYLVVRQPMPPPEAYNKRQDGLELWKHLHASPSGKFWSTSPFDGRRRVYLYQTLADYPLVVDIGIDEQDVLDGVANARIYNAQHAVGFTLVICCFALLLVLALRKSGEMQRTNEQLEQTNANMAKLSEEMRELSRTDFLTGLANRRALVDAVNAEIMRGKRFGSIAAVLMIDIDHFKGVNDTRGHDAGDRALVSLANVLKAMARATDLPARFGGEEFVFLLPGTDIAGAMEMAARIRREVHRLRVESPTGSFGFTVSIGATALIARDEDWNGLINRADKAMYEAKSLGRDRAVARADDPPA